MSRLGLSRPKAARRNAVEPAPASDNPIELDEELFSALGAQFGGENEALRNLLLDANNKINELDTIKAAVRKLVDPVSKALRDFEAEKTEKVGLQSVLSNTRTAYDKLRNEVGDLEKKLAAVGTRMQSAAPGPGRRADPTAHAGSGRGRDYHRRHRAPRARSPTWKRVSRSRPAKPMRCARRTAASTNGWSPPTSA